jgi:hypothetical protein
MPLYRVKHVSRYGFAGYENELVADTPGDALNIREAELGVDDEDYDVTVEPVPDPDGERARTWEKHFGVPR